MGGAHSGGRAPNEASRTSLLTRSRPPFDRHRRFLARPRAKWTLHQRAVVVLRLSGDLCANPGWQFDVLMLVPQLDFGDDQTEVVAGEHIDFPSEIPARDDLLHLLVTRPFPDLHHRPAFPSPTIFL